MLFLVLLIPIINCWGVETCTLAPLKGTPFCDISLPISQRINYLLKEMKIEEKIPMMDNTSPGLARLNINKWEWFDLKSAHNHKLGANFTGIVITSFPQITNMGRTFNKDLWSDMAKAISDEARALANLNQGYLSFWAPNINVYRDPRWGRGQETPGEDPFHTGQYAGIFINGMEKGEDYRYLKTLPWVYDLENWHGIDRYHFNAIVSDQDLQETFQPPFRDCVEIGQVHQIMCSYNAENGVPSCANELLQNTVIREEWGFDGHIVSDCGAINAIYADHKYKKTPEETCEVALKSGCDLDCGQFYGKNMEKAIEKKLVSEEDVDLAMYRLFENRIRLGEYDPWNDQPYRKIPKDVINSKKHQDLALQAALESMTLLKNDKNILPLDAKTYPKIAVIGPNAKATKTLQGNYYGPPPYLLTVFDEITKYTQTTYSVGCAINSKDKSHFDEAKILAQEADATILVMGIDCSIEQEGHDREEITFPGVQEDLIEEITKNSKGPVILVVIAGGGLDITYAKKNIPAILWGGYPGQSGGKAVASVLFGDYNPAGRLSFTIYPKEYTDECDLTDISMRPHKNCPGRTYKFYNKTAVYEFGDGLSFTTFKYEWSDSGIRYIQKGKVSDQHFTCKVTNTGERDGDVVVLAFITNTFNADAPKKQLFGFERIHLKKGESRTVFFGGEDRAFEYVDKNGDRLIQAGEYIIQIGNIQKKFVIF